MDPGAQNALVTALNALAVALSIGALAISGLAWFFSRAGRVRAFESKVYSQLTNAGARIENLESQWGAHKLEITGLCDEMLQAAEKAGKARRRMYADAQRAEKTLDVVPDEASLSPQEARARELHKVSLRLAGREA